MIDSCKMSQLVLVERSRQGRDGRDSQGRVASLPSGEDEMALLRIRNKCPMGFRV